VTLAVSTACALSSRCAGPLLSDSFPLDLRLRVPPCLFHPFGITRFSSDLAFETHPLFPRAHFFLSYSLWGLHVRQLVRLAHSPRHSYAASGVPKPGVVIRCSSKLEERKQKLYSLLFVYLSRLYMRLNSRYLCIQFFARV